MDLEIVDLGTSLLSLSFSFSFAFCLYAFFPFIHSFTFFSFLKFLVFFFSAFFRFPFFTVFFLFFPFVFVNHTTFLIHGDVIGNVTVSLMHNRRPL